MTELRKDLITREWVVIARERVKRPGDFNHQRQEAVVVTKDHSVCPFCEGNEAMTPSEICAVRDISTRPDSPGWKVRVIPNKFPALEREISFTRDSVGIYERMDGMGAHEVVIETPEHGKRFSDLTIDQIQDILKVYQRRYQELRRVPYLKYVLVFKNYGKVAGASIDHSHSQIIATPVIPQQVWTHVKGMEQYYEYRARCVYCHIFEAEESEGIRVVAQNKYFLSVEPYASKYPFETWIIPKKHKPHFFEAMAEELKCLAEILKETLHRIHVCLNDAPYNLMFINAPWTYQSLFHWHIEIIPRLTIAAGFELGTGMYINIVAPEDAARYLREAESKGGE
jgi:UDPglucose--hexose-1-phosphate uridylyltransferase